MQSRRKIRPPFPSLCSLTLFQSGPPLLTSAACLRDMQMVITPGAASSPFPACRRPLERELRAMKRYHTHLHTTWAGEGHVRARAMARELDNTG